MVRCRTWSAELLGRVTVKEFVKIHETESIYIPTGAVHQLEKSRPQRRFGKGADFVRGCSSERPTSRPRSPWLNAHPY